MSSFFERNPGNIVAVSDFNGDAAATDSGFSPVTAVRQERRSVTRIEVDVDVDLTVDAGSGGAADGAGVKLFTLPNDSVALGAASFVGTVTTSSGLSAANGEVGLGTAKAADGNEDLTGTEASLLDGVLGDGTLAAGASEAVNASVTNSATPVMAADDDVYLNIGGTFTHAADSTGTVNLTGTVALEVFYTGGF